mgnify:CR=1 FL=1
MTHSSGNAGKKASTDRLSVYLVPVTEQVANDPVRQAEIVSLVAQIILLGKSRKRASRKEKEEKYAA